MKVNYADRAILFKINSDAASRSRLQYGHHAQIKPFFLAGLFQ